MKKRYPTLHVRAYEDGWWHVVDAIGVTYMQFTADYLAVSWIVQNTNQKKDSIEVRGNNA